MDVLTLATMLTRLWACAVFAADVVAFSCYKNDNPRDEYECPNLVDPAIFYFGSRVATGIKNRALQTTPNEFYIAQSKIDGAGLGIFSNTFIPKYTWLGEYEGEYIPLNMTDMWGTHEYAWLISKNQKPAYYVDASDLRFSNWLRFSNCARHFREENVHSTACYGRIYYITSKDMVPGTELLVFYGYGYAMKLGVDVENYNNFHNLPN